MALRTVTPSVGATFLGIAFSSTEPAISYEGGSSYQGTIPALSTNFAVTFSCTIVNSVIQAIKASQDCTVKTNSTSSPGQTITLKKNKGRIWKQDDPAAAKIFTVDTTTLYITTGALDTDFQVACGDDITP